MVPIETLMYIRLLILIVEVGTPVLKDTFLEIVKTTFAGCNVDAFLLKYKKDIERLLILKVIAPSQYKIIFPKCGQTDIQEWDISLLCFVLLYCCTLKGKCNKVSDILKKVRLKNLLRTNQDTLKDMLDRNVITQGEFDSLQNNVYIGDIHSMDISLVTKLATFLCKDRNTDIIETLRATLKREIELYHKDLHDLLESNKALIDELCLTKEDYMTVFPDDGSKPNLYKLPDSVLCSVVLKLCRSICSEDVESVRSIRNILLHIPNTRIDAKTYLQYINRIKKHIDYFVELNPKQDSIQVKEHIESILKIELKSQEAVNEHLKKMYFGGHLGDDFPEGILKLIKTEMQDGFQDIRNDIQQTERSIKDKIDHESAKTQQRLDSIEKVLKLLAENKGNAVPLDSRPVAEIHVECENKELQNLAEKAVVDRTNDILNDRISDEQDPETTESLQNFIEQIHSCDAQIKMEKQCIMVFLSFTTMDGLLALIHRYKNGTLQLAVERIAVALEKRMQTRMRFKIELRPDVIEEMLNVKGKPLATISTVSDLKSGPPRLLFKCVSLAGLSNIWELYKTGKVSESLEMISTALSKRLGIGVKLTSYINLDSFEKALADAESCIANSETMTKQIFAEQRHLLSKRESCSNQLRRLLSKIVFFKVDE